MITFRREALDVVFPVELQNRRTTISRKLINSFNLVSGTYDR